ncbi:hypothetical protein D3C75_1136330 [compost metagenome]
MRGARQQQYAAAFSQRELLILEMNDAFARSGLQPVIDMIAIGACYFFLIGIIAHTVQSDRELLSVLLGKYNSAGGWR